MTSPAMLLTAVDGLLATATGDDYDQHVRRLGSWPRLDPAAIVTVTREAGLTGRGGAGFPTARKLEAVASAPGTPVVLANGAEGEPCSAKDAYLLQHAPHLVLDGVQLAARAVGARQAYVYVRGTTSTEVVSRALAERTHGALDPVGVEVVTASGGFVAGHESAAVAAVQGRPAVPSGAPVRVFERGVGRRPTLVQNVETLAHLALIARRGPGWYRSFGVPEDPGTFLATLGGSIERPGVVEAEHGIGLAELLGLGGGPSEPLRAVLLGGYFGTWLRWPQRQDVPLARPELQPLGADLGAGVVLGLPMRVCGLAAAAQIAEFLAGASARQCGPCLSGLSTIAGLLGRLAAGETAPGLPAEIERVSALVGGRGACAHPDGAARFVHSTLTVFADEVHAHLAGRCTAGGSR
jgi:NADH:ubiquinone oxidoreductase subunit F (NADH-binding)